jgi:hypothetical protein
MKQGKADILKKKAMLKQITINNRSNRSFQTISCIKKYFILKKSKELIEINNKEMPYNNKQDATPPNIKYFKADSKDNLL